MAKIWRVSVGQHLTNVREWFFDSEEAADDWVALFPTNTQVHPIKEEFPLFSVSTRLAPTHLRTFVVEVNRKGELTNFGQCAPDVGDDKVHYVTNGDKWHRWYCHVLAEDEEQAKELGLAAIRANEKFQEFWNLDPKPQ